MSWVLVAVAVVWVLSLLLVVALCLSARRTDRKLRGMEDVAGPPLVRAAEPSAGIEDITVRRTALS
jgi:hypothetical protein